MTRKFDLFENLFHLTQQSQLGEGCDNNEKKRSCFSRSGRVSTLNYELVGVFGRSSLNLHLNISMILVIRSASVTGLPL